MKRLAVLGSTGSIGINTLNVVRHLKNEVSITALAAHSNIDVLEAQAREFNPQMVAVYHAEQAKVLQARLPEIEVVAGMQGLMAVAAHHAVDFVVSAISGMIGLEPTLAAIQAGKDVGLANKESLVAGGQLLMEQVKANGVMLIPIDSEHSALFQCLQSNQQKDVRRLILTASGGPFLHYSHEQLAQVNVSQALSHPTWKMGAKITVDSSTLMNKGLEIIEAYWLFSMPAEKIAVTIHPQSIIHSMVEFVDGSMLAQMSEPSMVVPIQYAITYPERRPSFQAAFDFSKMTEMLFLPPNKDKFRCLQLAYDALHSGKSMPCYLNAANEVLVAKFLAGEITWRHIPMLLEELMQAHMLQNVHTLADIMAVDDLARKEAHDLLGSLLSKYGNLLV